VANATAAAAANATKEPTAEEKSIVDKMKALEEKISPSQAEEAAVGVQQGRLIVNGPLPTDFVAQFASAVAAATGCDKNAIKVIGTHGVKAALVQTDKNPEVEIVFEGPADVVAQVEAQAADENSPLVNGPLSSFLVAKEDPPAEAPPAEPTVSSSTGLEVDTEMPYGELEPFGREDTAQELTDQSIHESDEMVDQLERAEVAEEKRAVFRAITRLRGAAITSFDGIARSQTGNIDEYNHNHQWRLSHPLHHLADEESDVSKWAFPDNAD